jgi:glycosyltransferase involved in cell wall biosynthesis
MYDAHRIVRRLGTILFSNQRNPNELQPTAEINPFVIPFYDIPGIKKINDALLRNVLLRRIKDLDFRDFIIFSATPMVVDIIGTLGESSSHYFCLDDYSCYDGAYQCIGQLEGKMLQKVDSFFTLSEPLMQTRRARSGENHYLPMGVDTDLFFPSNEPLPPALESLKRPIVGFFGQIGSYVDIDLIVRCANAYPDATFIVIGRPHVDVSVFAQAPNIIFLGEIPYRDMPRYARGFDVGLNPRVLNRLSVAMNPLKILEYLSLGMPVVSTDLPAVRMFKDFVSIAESREHFVKLIGDALRDNDP